ncbi:hypothetical protein DFR50_14235 [Roseiarcus fermentans]|uniref:Uncharacterized protein n=1 Tax=Roseiarcus fermentans TaxID=1473586 RepID=A0A366EMY3_9HYPH|nr:hypothetical protein [Roseiarcus fermentans]RBP03787.1 hypothetical protein DFR50_14235 [Roseiarcus fermentans]
MKPILALLALALAGLALAGCQSTGGPAISAASVQADAKAAVQAFCATGLPAAQPFVAELNAQLQADYRTVSTACALLANGGAINPIAAAAAALALYDGLKATYPKAFTALAPADMTSLRRISVRGLR